MALSTKDIWDSEVGLRIKLIASSNHKQNKTKQKPIKLSFKIKLEIIWSFDVLLFPVALETRQVSSDKLMKSKTSSVSLTFVGFCCVALWDFWG